MAAELVHEVVEAVIVEVRESVVAGTGEELVLLSEDEAKLVNDIGVPLVESVLEETRELVSKQVLYYTLNQYLARRGIVDNFTSRKPLLI